MKKIMGIIVSVIMVLSSSPVAGQDDDLSGETVYVKEPCDLRTAPDSNGEVIERVSPGKSFIVLTVEDDGLWCMVKADDLKTGYIETIYLTTDSNYLENMRTIGKTVYAVETCPFMTLPGGRGSKIADVSPGTVFTVLSAEGNGYWFKVKSKTGQIGYIAVIMVTTDAKYPEHKRAEEAQQYDQALKSLRKKHPRWSINDCKTILTGKVRIGMSKEQCKEAWGDPDDIHNTTTAHGTHTQWCYGEYCSNALYFEDGILTAIQN